MLGVCWERSPFTVNHGNEAPILGGSVAITSVTEDDERAARDVIKMKAQINTSIDHALEFQAQSMIAHDETAMSRTRYENDIIDGLKRIYSLSKRIAKLGVPTAILADDA